MKKLTLLHMGDSITFGQYVDPALRWSSLVANEIRDRTAGAFELTSVNHGISGETTRMGLERYPKDVQEVGAHVQTLQFGMNDCNCWQTDHGLPRVSERAFRANFHEMIARSRRFNVAKLILMTNPRSLRVSALPSGEPYDDANARYSAIIREIAKEEGLPLCDIRAAFDTLSPATLTDYLLPAPDLLHLSPAGNRFYADTIFPYIQQAINELIPSFEAAPL